jgi:hypothetical protein
MRMVKVVRFFHTLNVLRVNGWAQVLRRCLR